MDRPRKKPSPSIRWSARLKRLPVLSVKQPWAWLIVNGFKDVENRSWTTHYRGPVLIHAGVDRRRIREATLIDLEERYQLRLPREFDFGGIIGTVEIIDCAKRPGSPWHVRGQVGWMLARPRQLPFRPMKGFLGLFRPVWE